MSDIETTQAVMDCPACDGTIEAQVAIKVETHFGGLSEDLRHVEVKADPRIVRFKVEHHCRGRIEPKDLEPHSRACGARLHDHGAACHANCPTCEGSPL